MKMHTKIRCQYMYIQVLVAHGNNEQVPIFASVNDVYFNFLQIFSIFNLSFKYYLFFHRLFIIYITSTYISY